MWSESPLELVQQYASLTAEHWMLLVGAALAVYLIHWARWAWTFPYVGPTNYPFVGALFSVLKHYEERLDFLTEETLKLPGRVWGAWFLGQGTVILAGTPATVQHVLKDNFYNYEKGPYFRKRFKELLGDGIFNSDGHQWLVQRKTASHMFTQATLRDYMFGVFVRHGQELLQTLRTTHAAGREVDIQRLYFAFTLDSIGEIAFGVNVGSLHNPDHPFAKAFDTAQKLCEARFFSPVFQIAPCLHPREWRLRKAVRVLDKFAYNVIEARRHSLATTNEADAPREDLLSRFMMHRDQDTGKPYEKRMLRDVVLNFIIAGRDTTAQALSWCTYLLTQNPDKEAKMVEEIHRVLGDGPVTFQAVQRLEYVEAVISETLRLYPSVPVDTKVAVGPDILPGGHPIKKGDWVLYAPYVMGRDPALWKDPRSFTPERWLEMPSKPSPFKWPSFNAGPRTCLGMRMAFLEAKTMLAMIYRECKPRLVPGHKVQYLVTATLPMKYGLRVTPNVQSGGKKAGADA